MRFLFVMFIAVFALGATETLDFWENSPRLWKRLRDDRQILVSAVNEDGRTVSKGAGLVNAPPFAVWNFATDPKKILTSSRFLKSFTWDQASGDIDMRIEILSIRYRLRGRAVKRPDVENPSIELEVYEGDLVPFTAVLEIRSAKAQAAREGAPTFPEGKSLVRISGLSTKDRALSWPLRVALEALLQRTAGYLREAVEADAPATVAIP